MSFGGFYFPYVGLKLICISTMDLVPVSIYQCPII